MIPNRFPDTQSFLAVSLVLSIVLLAFLLAFTGKTDTDIFKILVGGMMTVGFASIVGYYFGSSSGSKDKDTAMTAVVERLTPPTGAVNGAFATAVAVEAAALAAPAAAAIAAPAAAATAAPPAAATAAPPAADIAAPPAVEAALKARDAAAAQKIVGGEKP